MRQCILLIVMVGVFSMAEVAEAEKLFVSDDEGFLWQVANPELGILKPVGQMDRAYEDLAFSSTGRLFAITHQALYEVFPGTLRSRFIGLLGVDSPGPIGRKSPNALTFGRSGHLFFSSYAPFNSSERFGIVDTRTGEATPIGNPGFNSSGGLAFTPQGRLIMSSCTPTGVRVECSERLENRSIDITPGTGDAFEIDETGFTRIAALSSFGSSFYGFTTSGQIVEINGATGRGHLVALTAPFVSVLGASNVHLLGDTDGNDVIDISDLNNVRNNFGTVGSSVLGDTNRDGVVDVADLNNVRNNFGNSLQFRATGVAVPEPDAITILLIGATLILGTAIIFLRLRRAP